ncbi:unnamed protein product [Orchesella dallaii]|uniref:Uncharacterized protein n=1 Tax=Orchesella dallaii TaxID=48710 RepID=A0ABP1R6N7_9HEXA
MPQTRMNTGIMNKVNFTNVDQLPCTITSLHFKDNPEDRLFIHQESIFSLEQIQWIIANLKQLESLWLQLLTEEQIENDVEGEADNEDEEENDNDDEDDFWEELEIPELQNIFHQQIENIERLEVQQNMNVPTFRELISMPKLTDMKFDMLIAGEHRPILAVEFGPRYYVPLQSISPMDIQEYIDVCEQDQRIMFNVNEVEAFPFRFTELSITRGY